MSVWQELVALGPRFAGTPADAEVAQLLARRFTAAGLDVSVEPFPFVGWEPLGPATLEVLSPRTAVVPACTMIRSASGVAEGTLRPVGRRSVIGVFQWEHYEIAGPDGSTVGLLVEREDGPAIPQCLEELSDIPAAVVGTSWLQNVANSSVKDVRVRLTALCTPVPDGRSQNVIARTSGTRGPEILVCAHYDTMYGSAGANDNASGVDVVCRLADGWRDLPKGVSFTFAAFGGEEWLQLGSRAYLQKSMSRADRAAPHLVLNVDMVGSGTYLWPSVTEHTKDLVRRAHAELAPEVGLKYHMPPMCGDHYPFHEQRIPTVMLLWWPDAVYHTPADAGEGLQPATLDLSTRLARRIIELASRPGS